ncbi:hypothetical protein MJO28_001975 [Puccinia striiformis f. sp. tritici]|uniref:Uncharacterized protein n=1 Tax=Puccinia striiformis f. sp. tritici TaxID=168172 RepID=A0ACC0EW48_9BASI|nr:hypothetical protein MJO28_001975 [Puccinia striiformis f. sp. tritici]
MSDLQTDTNRHGHYSSQSQEDDTMYEEIQLDVEDRRRAFDLILVDGTLIHQSTMKVMKARSGTGQVESNSYISHLTTDPICTKDSRHLHLRVQLLKTQY